MGSTSRHAWEPPIAGTEVEHLTGALDRLRATFRWKADGLDSAGLQARVGASALTLGGLLKHLAAAEDYCFTTKLSGDPMGEPWDANGSDGSNDWEFTSAADDTPEELYTLWDGAVERSRARLDKALADGGLDQPAHVFWPDGRHASLRRLVCDLIEEYGRHTGHADLLREAVDGRVGEDPPPGWRPSPGATSVRWGGRSSLARRSAVPDSGGRRRGTTMRHRSATPVVAALTLLVAVPASAATITGTSGDDVLAGTSAADTINALGGDDVVHARAGGDVVFGGLGRDNLMGDHGADRLYGGPGGDKAYGGLGPDLVVGRRGWDRILGGGGADRLSGGPGRDHVFGDDGADSLHGGPGGDWISGGPSTDTIHGGPGNDLISDSVITELGQALREPDLLVAGGGRDRVIVADGVDRALAGPGRDLVTTYDDGMVDRIDCGPGVDVVRYEFGARDPKDVLRHCERVRVIS